MSKLVTGVCNKKSRIIKTAALVILFFGINLYLSFATDTYATFKTGFSGAAWDMFTRNGRPIIGLIYKLHSLSGLSNASFYYISSVFALVFLGLSVWIYRAILEKYGVSENISILLAFAAIANIFIIEYFMFIEKCGFMLAILFDTTGIYWIDRFFSDRQKKYLCLAVISVTLAILTYQGTIAIFAILSIPFALKQAKNFKQYILNGAAIGVTYAIPVIIDLAAFKFVFKSTRIVAETNYIENLNNVISGLSYFSSTTFDILPKHLFQILAFIIFAAAVVTALISPRKVLNLFNVFIILLAVCVFPTATILQGSGWWSTRTVYPLASVAAALAINIFVNGDAAEGEKCIKKCAQWIPVGVIAILLVSQYFSFNKIYIDKYKVNALDQYRYECVSQAIHDYQDSTGTEITKVAFYSDAERLYPQYANLFCNGDLVVSAFATEWSNVAAMNYYLNSDYEKVEPTEEYTAYFSEKNWNHFSQDQLIFDGDTLHICVY